jgi:hypothetical protein
MTTDNKKTTCETDFCFALALLLTNVLILTALSGTIWLLYSLVTQSNLLFSFGNAFPRN